MEGKKLGWDEAACFLEKYTGDCSSSRSNVSLGQSVGVQADVVTCGVEG